MLTLCTIPRAFTGHTGIIQRNAIRSWRRLPCNSEILLFGNDPGVPEMAEEVGGSNRSIRCNEYGTPLLNDLFEQAHIEGKHDYICYVNTDIILLEDFFLAVQLAAKKFREFLMIGRRWNLDLTQEIQFAEGWQDRLREDAMRRGELFGLHGVDYFVFPRKVDFEFPPFSVGRPNWDNWFLYRARSLRMPLIDATDDVLAIHQNHDYKHVAKRIGPANDGPEGDINLKLAGGEDHIFGLDDATHRLSNKRIQRILTRNSLKMMRLRLPVLYPSLMPIIRPVRAILGGLRKLGLKV